MLGFTFNKDLTEPEVQKIHDTLKEKYGYSDAILSSFKHADILQHSYKIVKTMLVLAYHHKMMLDNPDFKGIIVDFNHSISDLEVILLGKALPVSAVFKNKHSILMSIEILQSSVGLKVFDPVDPHVLNKNVTRLSSEYLTELRYLRDYSRVFKSLYPVPFYTFVKKLSKLLLNQ